MIERHHLAALGGFAFVAAWIGFGFGDAVLCLLGAAVAWAVVGALEGKVDLAALQSRFSGEDEAPPVPPRQPAPAPTRRAGRPRVR
jgi:hypothetical protein